MRSVFTSAVAINIINWIMNEAKAAYNKGKLNMAGLNNSIYDVLNNGTRCIHAIEMDNASDIISEYNEVYWTSNILRSIIDTALLWAVAHNNRTLGSSDEVTYYEGRVHHMQHCNSRFAFIDPMEAQDSVYVRHHDIMDHLEFWGKKAADSNAKSIHKHRLDYAGIRFWLRTGAQYHVHMTSFPNCKELGVSICTKCYKEFSTFGEEYVCRSCSEKE